MKQKKIPLRKCTGCNEMKPKKELIRIVRSPEVKNEDGEVIVEGTDYKNKLIGYEGHKLVISMDTNRILKFSLLEDLLGWKFK